MNEHNGNLMQAKLPADRDMQITPETYRGTNKNNNYLNMKCKGKRPSIFPLHFYNY